jgi:outer membrane protein OmpA-like peptidoglycan-associated protein
MLGLCLISCFLIFQTVDSTVLIKRQALDSVNQFHSQYFPHYSAKNKLLLFTSRTEKNQDENLFYSQLEHLVFTKATPLSILNQEYNEGTACLSEDGKTMIFSGCNYVTSYGSCDLFETKWINGMWSKPKNLGFLINSHDWEGQPYLSKNGQQLYFSSDRQGGIGKRDIWMSTKNEQGIWQKPVNLGEAINTQSDEQGPYLLEERNILVYSSNQPLGKGGLDFYQSIQTENIFQKGVNILAINTPKDDAGFSMGVSQNEFYLSSNIEGKDLIYSVIIPEKIWLKNTILKEKPIATIIVDSLQFNDIQFASNQWELPIKTPNSLIELQKYLKENLQQKIKISGHTDESGSEELNQILSEKRALAVKLYLIQQGISSNRIQFQGFGFSQSKSKDRAQNRRIQIELL